VDGIALYRTAVEDPGLEFREGLDQGIDLHIKWFIHDEPYAAFLTMLTEEYRSALKIRI
jgi:hypothetical protein